MHTNFTAQGNITATLTNGNHNTTTNYNVQIAGFGTEQMSRLESLLEYVDTMTKIVQRKDETCAPVVECARFKHFNPKLPEFQNVCHKNASKNEVWVHNGEKWTVRSLSDIQIELMVAGADMMAEFILRSSPQDVSPSLWNTVSNVPMPPDVRDKCAAAGRDETAFVGIHPSRLQNILRNVRKEIANMILNSSPKSL